MNKESMTTIKDLLEPMKARLAKWNEELPKLIQPEPWLIRDRANLARLIEAVEVMDEALEHYANEEMWFEATCLGGPDVAREARAEAAKILANDGGRVEKP